MLDILSMIVPVQSKQLMELGVSVVLHFCSLTTTTTNTTSSTVAMQHGCDIRHIVLLIVVITTRVEYNLFIVCSTHPQLIGDGH